MFMFMQDWYNSKKSCIPTYSIIIVTENIYYRERGILHILGGKVLYF